ncbi:MAG: hypothetical protein KDI53_02055 [Candidatus Accumulibacter sp.]|nr:hypothetical protein [Accumulibacter sp.]
MTTPPRTTSNKTALRASLKKEDDSLADRLAAADAPPAKAEAAPVEEAAGAPAAAPARRVATRSTARAAAKPPVEAKAAATAAAARTPRKAAPAKAPAAKAAAAAAAAPKARPARTKAPAAVEPGPVEQLEKVVKQKRDKLVRYSVELLKSEEAAIDSLRDELSRAAGWAASKSDIVRAGVRAFAAQKVEQMQNLLGSLAPTPQGKGDKKGKKGKKGKK